MPGPVLGTGDRTMHTTDCTHGANVLIREGVTRDKYGYHEKMRPNKDDRERWGGEAVLYKVGQGRQV